MAEPDNKPADVSAWFLTSSEGNPKLGNTLLSGNDVTYFIEYRDYYKALAEALSKAVNKDHFIYFVDWQLILDTWMDAPSGRVTFRTLLQDADKRGVQIRSLLYDGQALQDPVHNDDAVKWLSKLTNGGAYLDSRYLIAGSHHQKMVIINNSDGVVAFCGGMDIAEDRQQRDGGPKPPQANLPVAWHDVQVRVTGPATLQLWRTFNARWLDLQYCLNTVNKPSVQTPPFPSQTGGKKSVQVVRTFGNGTKHAGLSILPNALMAIPNAPSTYDFAPAGEMTIYKLLARAISNTTSTIYLEDQYLVESERMGSNPSIPELLAATISKSTFKQMVILAPGAGSLEGELCQVWRRRSKFWSLLGPDAAAKVKIYTYRNLPVSPYLMHSKTWIFDDTMAVVSSANCNRRSYSHDSEVGVGIADPSPDKGKLPFAKDLRVNLWLKHLNLKGPARTASDVDDFVAAAALWDTPNTALEPLDLTHPILSQDHHISKLLPAQITFDMPALSLMLSFDPSLTVNLFSWDREWDNVIDPDGS